MVDIDQPKRNLFELANVGRSCGGFGNRVEQNITVEQVQSGECLPSMLARTLKCAVIFAYLKRNSLASYSFVNSGNTMNESFQITDKYISNQSGLYKSNEHSQNGNNVKMSYKRSI